MAVEFADSEDFRRWLGANLEVGGVRELTVMLAARSALRALPGIGRANDKALSIVVLPVLRATLTSSVGTIFPTDDVIRTATHSTARTARAADSAARSTLSSRYAALSAAASADTYSAADPARAAASAANSAAYSAAYAPADSGDSAAYSAAYSALSADAQRRGGDAGKANAFASPLWHDAGMPRGLANRLERLEAFFAASPDVWGFWQRWYRSHLEDGAPLDWKLQEAVARIPDADWLPTKERDSWEKVAAHIAGLIAEIEAGFARAQAQLGETLVLNEATLVYSAKVVEAADPGRLERHLSRVDDALDDLIALGGHNGPTENTNEYRIIKRLVAKYSADPERVAFDLTDVQNGIKRKIKDKEYPDSEPIRFLQASILSCVSVVTEMEPDVAQRLEQAYPRAPEVPDEDGAEIIAAALEISTATLDQDAAETTREDMAELFHGLIIDAAEEGLPDGPRRVAETYRAVVLRRQISRLGQQVADFSRVPALAEHYDSKWSKAAGVVGRYSTVGGLFTAAIVWLARMAGLL